MGFFVKQASININGRPGMPPRLLVVHLTNNLNLMKQDISKGLQRRKKQILEDWMTQQLSSTTLREDLMSNEDLREQSNELLDTLLKSLNDRNIADVESSEFEPVYEILSGISMSRARQGFSPKETGLYVFTI